ncbi:MAG: hypothetical protein P1V97_13095 [Planctomycetota bacterium]|nr:hypothetical protein [Planctomycetota bacterium]
MVTSANLCVRRKLFSATCFALAVLIWAPSDAGPDKEKAKSLTFKTVQGAYGVVELSQAGRPFFRTFFKKGWPTTQKAKSLTLQDSQGAAEDTLQGLMASGMGIKFSDSTYMEYLRQRNLKKRGAPWTRNSDIVNDKLLEFSTIAGLPKPKIFSPVLLEFSQGTAKVSGGYKEDKWSSQQWVNVGVANKELSMDAVCMSLYAQALYARQQLVDNKHILENNRYAFGTDAKSAYLGLVSLQLALAKLHEIKTRGIVYKGKLGTFRALSGYGLTGNKAWIPHRIKVKGRGAGLSFVADTKKDALQSQLFDQAVLLLGCTELLKITAWAKQTGPKTENEKLLATLFKDGKFGAFNDTPIDPKSFDLVLDIALFIITNLQRLHYDFDSLVFRSRSSKDPDLEKIHSLNAVDAGFTMLALKSFLVEVQQLLGKASKNDSGLKTRLIRKQRLARTQLKFLSRWVCKIVDKRGLSDRYNIKSRSAMDKTFDASAAGFLARGLFSLKSLPTEDLAQANREVAESTGYKVLKEAESKLWNPEYKLYIGRTLAKTPSAANPLAVNTLGQVSMLGVMRDLANLKNDVRYLIRYGEILGSLKSRGFINAETNRGGESGGDSDGDGVWEPGAKNHAPALMPEIHVDK